MHPLTALPILPSMLDEAQRVLITIWVVPLVKETVEGWMELVAILQGW
jgi:hypothetical protein